LDEELGTDSWRLKVDVLRLPLTITTDKRMREDAMEEFERGKIREELEEALLPFRLMRRQRRKRGCAGRGGTGWLKNVREAIGMPVSELAQELGVSRWEIHRVEASEMNARIKVATLSRMAKGLGCELVYALVPKTGTLESMAATHRRAREKEIAERQWQQKLKRKPWLEEIGFREIFLRYLRTKLRKEGFRVRPRKTDNGVAKQEEAFREMMKLAGLAGGKTGTRDSGLGPRD
jgi:transcriptional regulator with XRE-family HTH domain